MCFTPLISLSTAIVEFLLAGILVFGFKRYWLRYFWGTVIFLLGFYQLTEYFLCTTQQPVLWAQIGFISYTFLPALALHSVYRFLRKKAQVHLFYVLPVAYSLYALMAEGFVQSATCEKVFVDVTGILSQPQGLLQYAIFFIYGAYYIGFILAGCLLLGFAYRHERSRKRKQIELIEILAVILPTVPFFILIILFPFLGVMYPSVLCQFAIVFAVLVFVGCYIDNRRS